MRPIEFWPAVLPFVLAAALSVAGLGQGHAAESDVFIVAGDDGYGVEDCLGEGGDCGRVVADAWCEAHGHGAALSFGVAADITGSIADGQPSASSHPYVVRCGR